MTRIPNGTSSKNLVDRLGLNRQFQHRDAADQRVLQLGALGRQVERALHPLLDGDLDVLQSCSRSPLPVAPSPRYQSRKLSGLPGCPVCGSNSNQSLPLCTANRVLNAALWTSFPSMTPCTSKVGMWAPANSVCASFARSVGESTSDRNKRMFSPGAGAFKRSSTSAANDSMSADSALTSSTMSLSVVAQGSSSTGRGGKALRRVGEASVACVANNRGPVVEYFGLAQATDRPIRLASEQLLPPSSARIPGR